MTYWRPRVHPVRDQVQGSLARATAGVNALTAGPVMRAFGWINRLRSARRFRGLAAIDAAKRMAALPATQNA